MFEINYNLRTIHPSSCMNVIPPSYLIVLSLLRRTMQPSEILSFAKSQVHLNLFQCQMVLCFVLSVVYSFFVCFGFHYLVKHSDFEPCGLGFSLKTYQHMKAFGMFNLIGMLLVTSYKLGVPESNLKIFVSGLFWFDYILGDNPRATSYMVGYGSNYPLQVHQRSSSIISYKVNPLFVSYIRGYSTWFSNKGSDPNVLHGALVGGPDQNDNFADERDNYE